MKAFSWLAGNKLTHITCNNATFFWCALSNACEVGTGGKVHRKHKLLKSDMFI